MVTYYNTLENWPIDHTEEVVIFLTPRESDSEGYNTAVFEIICSAYVGLMAVVVAITCLQLQ